MFFFPIFPAARRRRKAARQLYARIVTQSRAPVFYARLGVPDSFTGRFEMIALHTGLLINRVRKDKREGELLAQALFDEMFLNMELGCRQVGIGDLSVPKQIKKMMKALQGRARTYEDAALQGRTALAEALAKNLYATVEPPAIGVLTAMADYVMECNRGFAAQSLADFTQGVLLCSALPQDHGDRNAEIADVA